MKFVFITIVALFGLNLNIAAQEINVKGYVSDSNLNPIDAATVSLCKPDSVVITSTITNSDGYFEFIFKEPFPPEKNRILAFSHISYKNKTLTITHLNDTVVNVLLEEGVHTLGEVSIIADRPAIEFSDGNLIANVSQIPHIQTANVTTLLSRLPGVTASEQEGLTYNGATAVLYIDGRKQNMNSATIISFLNALPASSIEQVELKSMGLASYDASGQAVINIKTKKQRVDGYHGSIGLQGTVYESKNTDGGSNLTFITKRNRIMFNTTLSFRNKYSDVNSFDSTSTGIGNDIVINRSFQGRTNTINGLANLKWEAHSGHILNLNLFSYNDKGSGEIIEPTYIYYPSSQLFYVQSTNNERHDDLWAATISYNSPESNTSKINLTYSYLFGGIRTERDIFRNDNTEEWMMNSSARMLGNRHTGEFRFDHMFVEKLHLTLGAKNDYGEITEDVNYLLNNDFDFDYPNSNFIGSENIFASFFELRYTYNESWSIYSGLRTENTNYNINLITENSQNNDSYWNIFPSFTITYNGTKYRTSFGLVSSIMRPNYEWLLPGKRYSNDYFYYVGNPNLKPVKSYGLRWNQMFFNFINLNLGYSLNKDVYTVFLIERENGLTERTHKNVVDAERLFASLSLPFAFFNNNLTGRLNTDFNYYKMQSISNEYMIRENRSEYSRFELRLFMQYQITKNFAIHAWAGYFPTRQSLQYDLASRESLDFGINYITNNKKLTIALDAENIVGNFNGRYTYLYDMNTRVLNYDVNSRFIKLSVLYNISGGDNVKDKEIRNQSETGRF